MDMAFGLLLCLVSGVIDESRSGRRPPRGAEPAGRGEPLRGLQRKAAPAKIGSGDKALTTTHHKERADGIASPYRETDGSAQVTLGDDRRHVRSTPLPADCPEGATLISPARRRSRKQTWSSPND